MEFEPKVAPTRLKRQAQEASVPSDHHLELAWSSNDVRHRDTVYLSAREGADFKQTLGAVQTSSGKLPSQMLAPWSTELVIDVRPADLLVGPDGGPVITPRPGRWYPTRFIRPTIELPVRCSMFRCVATGEDHLRLDLNHALSAFAPSLEVHATNRPGSLQVHPTGSLSWRRWLDAGPGIQARHADVVPNFFGTNALRRDDEEDDQCFYTMPRLVHHIDTVASEQIAALYGCLIPPGARVLDLMSSWVSHLPADLELGRVEGLGMNADELSKNPHLHAYRVYDLNMDPALPYADACFDVVICSLSIEYLVRPAAVLKEVARVLDRDGLFICSFSNRWFPPKAIHIWPVLHDFERVGLVQALLIDGDMFHAVQSWSVVGLARPLDDPYRDRFCFSDPVYAVWGTRRN